jgi:DNA-binding NtrC family response regulator
MTKVLLIENDPLHAMLHQSILEKKFSSVDRVADPAAALCLLEQPRQNFDLVVCGPQRSGFGGAAFLQELHYRRPGLPVLVLGRPGDRADEFAEPDVAFLAAPVDGKDLIAVAGRLLNPAHGSTA